MRKIRLLPEDEFYVLWKECSIISLIKQYPVTKEIGRKHKADFVHLETKIMIEIEGGTWTNGRHVRGIGYAKDCEKYNLCTFLGWKIIRLTSNMITEDWIKLIDNFIRHISEKK